MSWYESPEVQRARDGTVEVWRLLGDWTRDLPLEVRGRAVDALDGAWEQALVIDLSDVKFIDSWGEETVCDVLQRASEEGLAIAWAFDGTRPHDYEGVVRALARRRLTIRAFPQRTAAVAAVGSP